MSIATRIDPEQELATHRARRRAEAIAKRGPASFVWGQFVTDPGTVVDGEPGRWAPLPDGRAGLVVTASAEEGIRIGGALVDGTAVLRARPEDGPAIAVFPDGAEGILFAYDETKYALQVWNPRSAWARRFADISAYPYDPSWVLDIDIVPTATGRTVAIAHHRDPRPIEVPVLAEARFVRDGRTHVLLGASSGPDRPGLTLLFTDATSGTETYAAGRSLYLPDRSTGRTVADFNCVSLLPCAFSLAWNCPIPAAENHLDIPVRAGEKHAIDHDGKDLL